jgi:hypothetical protein
MDDGESIHEFHDGYTMILPFFSKIGFWICYGSHGELTWKFWGCLLKGVATAVSSWDEHTVSLLPVQLQNPTRPLKTELQIQRTCIDIEKALYFFNSFHMCFHFIEKDDKALLRTSVICPMFFTFFNSFHKFL